MRRYCIRCNSTIEDSSVSTCSVCGAERPEWNWPKDAWIGEPVVGGQYRVVKRLGAGGYGVVYEVETAVGGLRRALKVLNPEWVSNEVARERFINEALVLEQVNHPNVARCYAVGKFEDRAELYMLLELIDGVQLDALVRPDMDAPAKPIAPRRAISIAKQIASGLVAAHDAGVLHRDLKPPNILVTNAGSPDEQAKLLDFGIAKLTEEGSTSTKNVVGTPLYMAPEQFSPGVELDARLDLWQLGATLFYMLTGRPPYDIGDQNVLALLDAHDRHRTKGPAPSELNEVLAETPAIDNLVQRLLATDTSVRPESAMEVCEELARLEHALSPGAGLTGSLALLEALCADPNDGAWWALCRYLRGRASDGEGLARAAARRLESWPDELRRIPVGWFAEARRDEPGALWSLGRTLDLSGQALDDEAVSNLACVEALSTVTRLSLANNALTRDGVAVLCRSPHLSGLVHLDLSGNRIGAAGVEELASTQSLASLRELVLRGCAIGTRGAEALAESTLSLRVLDLADNDIGGAGTQVLAASESMSNLSVLRLRGNAIGADGVAAIATSRTLVRLNELDLSRNALGPGGVAALALSANLGSLRTLNLAGNALGLQGLQLMVGSARSDTLDELDLSSNEFGSRGAMVLASSPFARRLGRLEIADNQLGDAGLVAMLNAPHLSALHTLGVAQNNLRADGAKLLSAAPPKLEQLDISRNELGPQGASALAEALPSMRIRSLVTADCDLGPDGLAAVVRAGGGRLAELHAAGNSLKVDGARVLGRASELGAIQVLDLGRNHLGTGGAAVLAASQFISNLRALHLDGNDIGDEGLASLVAAADSMPLLERLSLRDNGIGRLGCNALSRSALNGRLGVLDLAFNDLGDAGVDALAKDTQWRSLHQLDLRKNGIGHAGVAAILSAPSMAQVFKIDLSHNAVGGERDMHSLADDRVGLMEESFAVVAGQGPKVIKRFYEELFSRYPAVKPLFNGVSMPRQETHLLQALALVIDNVRNPDAAEHALSELAERHIDYGVTPSQYYAVTSTLLDVLAEAAGDLWNEALHDAWFEGLDAVATVMLRAHMRAAAARRKG